VFTSHAGRNGFSTLTSFLTLKRASASYVYGRRLSVRLRTKGALQLIFLLASNPTTKKIEDRGLWIEDRITRYNAIFNLQPSIFDLRCLLWDSRIPTHERW
jgi:hypothetical protein